MIINLNENIIEEGIDIPYMSEWVVMGNGFSSNEYNIFIKEYNINTNYIREYINNGLSYILLDIVNHLDKKYYIFTDSDLVRQTILSEEVVNRNMKMIAYYMPFYRRDLANRLQYTRHLNNITFPYRLEYVKINQEEIDKFKEVCDTHCKYIFGEDNYRFVINRRKIEVYLKFPKIYISNNEGQNKVLRDLYVRITFEIRETLCITAIEGARGVLNACEKQFGYCHSHLHIEHYDYNTFCLGDSALGNLFGTLKVSYNENIFIGLLYQLPEFMSYESLEGGPYIRMAEVSLYKRESRPLNIQIEQYAKRIVKHILYNPKSPYKLSDLFTIIIGKEVAPMINIKVKNIDFIPLIKSCLDKKKTDNSNKLIDKHGDIVTLDSRFVDKKPNRTTMSIKFGEEDIPIRVIPVDDEDIELESTYRGIKSLEDNSDKTSTEISKLILRELQSQGDNFIKSTINIYKDEYIEYCEEVTAR